MSSQPDFTRRHTVYIDGTIQKWLLIALVVLEVVLVAGALWALYLQLNNMIEANLYRAHINNEPNLYPLLRIALVGLSGLVTINIVVLWAVDWVWARHLNSILQPFNELMGKAEILDFSEDAPAAIPHKVVELVRTWRETERQRLLNLRAAITRLELSGDLPAPEAQEHMHATLGAILKLLP